MSLLNIILSVVLPPLAVGMNMGLGKHFWINLLLTIIGWVPGVIHALWILNREIHTTERYHTHETKL